MTTHRTGPMTAREKRRNRYSETASRLAWRYTDPTTGMLATHVNGQPTRYYTLEALAAVKYLGCDPTKLGVPGLESIPLRR